MLIKDRHTMPSGAEDRHARRLVPGRSDNERGGSRPVREVSANHKDNHFFNLDKFGTVDSGEDPDELVADVPGALEADSKKREALRHRPPPLWKYRSVHQPLLRPEPRGLSCRWDRRDGKVYHLALFTYRDTEAKEELTFSYSERNLRILESRKKGGNLGITGLPHMLMQHMYRKSKRDRDPEGSVVAFWVVDRISRRVGACLNARSALCAMGFAKLLLKLCYAGFIHHLVSFFCLRQASEAVRLGKRWPGITETGLPAVPPHGKLRSSTQDINYADFTKKLLALHWRRSGDRKSGFSSAWGRVPVFQKAHQHGVQKHR
jgi:hypothetical protein